MGSLGRTPTHYDTSAFVRRWLLALLMYSHRVCHLRQQQPSTTVFVYYQVQQWKGTVDELLPQEWGWKESDGGLSLSRLTYHQLHWNSYGSSDAPARQTAAA
ncbi:hypothetical protein AAFF_G00190090 [Aldrovandia affinis]|uniref:Uncharacterized protein n=1 Tax=Aldrovandia affinis TaxID=143900 RepID=A0AAD7RJC0_9TELE|nr:hypothetical protein AAFF_G00190090 [Aldrovandia affinis]